MTREWYGLPIVVMDSVAVASLGGGVAALASGSGRAAASLMLGGLGVYVLGGPIVHYVQDRPDTVASSLLLRLGAPVGGLMGGSILGYVAASGCEEEFCQAGGALYGSALGLVGGMVVAMVVDSSVFAYKPVPRKTLSLSFMPSYVPTTGDVGLNLHGAW